jgi:hypothetical protein
VSRLAFRWALPCDYYKYLVLYVYQFLMLHQYKYLVSCHFKYLMN